MLDSYINTADSSALESPLIRSFTSEVIATQLFSMPT